MMIRLRGWISRICRVAGSGAMILLVVLVIGVIGTHMAQAQTYKETIVYNFQPSPDGANPYAGVFKDSVENLYGTTSTGGTGPCNYYDYPGCGVVYKVDPAGNETVLYNFMGAPDDGDLPFQGLVGIANGTLYGTTYLGGSGECHNGSGNGCGIVFQLDAGGNETILHNFAGGKKDGCEPDGRLLRDKMGNLYGTTYQCGASNKGTVFKLYPTGKEAVLHSFTGSGRIVSCIHQSGHGQAGQPVRYR